MLRKIEGIQIGLDEIKFLPLAFGSSIGCLYGRRRTVYPCYYRPSAVGNVLGKAPGAAPQVKNTVTRFQIEAVENVIETDHVCLTFLAQVFSIHSLAKS